jgi:hypothetical protein
MFKRKKRVKLIAKIKIVSEAKAHYLKQFTVKNLRRN